MNQYKIMDKNTGLYSTGGYEPNWTKKGKTYNSLGLAIAAIKLYARGHYGHKNQIPDSWSVVEFLISPVKEYVAKDLIDERKLLCKYARID